MRVSVVNYCSTRLDMLRFSTEMLTDNAGIGRDDYDYIVCTMNATPEVAAWIAERPWITHVKYKPAGNLPYVPNLRAMMNYGWTMGATLNDYVCIVNTDMAFGRDWLENLITHASPDVIPNSTHLTPAKGDAAIKANFGVPTHDTFDLDAFWQKHDEIWANEVWTEEERGGWNFCATFPYVVNNRWWHECGPWALEHDHRKRLAPDRYFFQQCHDAGARFCLVGNSICYHHEAVERRGKRPPGCEQMREGT